MAASLRVALVGCGAMGSIVARDVYAAATDLGVSLACVVDTDPSRAAALAAAVGVPGFDSFDQALDRVAVDAVDVRTPHLGHEEVAVAAAQRGLQLLVEKPLAADLGAAERIVAAAERSRVTLAVAENYPHLAAVAAARTALATGRIGEPVALRTTRAYRLDGVWVQGGWRTGDSPQAGILLDQGTHQASLVRLLGGPIAAVSAVPSAGSGGDSVALTLRLASGAVAQSLLTWSSPGAGPATEAEVYGTTGRLAVVVDYDGHSGGCLLGTTQLTAGENYYDTHRAIVADLARAVATGTEPLVTGRAALDDLRVVAAAIASLRDGGSPVVVS